MFTGLVLSVVNRMQWQLKRKTTGKENVYSTLPGGKNWVKQRKQWPTGPKANSLHTVESLRRGTCCCCCSQPDSHMLATVLEWLTDFSFPHHLVDGFDTYVQITGVFCEGHIVFVGVCFFAKGENFFRLKRMPSILSLHQRHIQCVHVFNVQSQKKNNYLTESDVGISQKRRLR